MNHVMEQEMMIQQHIDCTSKIENALVLNWFQNQCHRNNCKKPRQQVVNTEDLSDLEAVSEVKIK